MLMQVAPHFPPPTREELDGASFRIIIYSTNGLASTSIAARYEWGFVPARVTVDGESFKDHVEISAATVFNKYRTNPDFKMGTGGATVGDMFVTCSAVTARARQLIRVLSRAFLRVFFFFSHTYPRFCGRIVCAMLSGLYRTAPAQS